MNFKAIWLFLVSLSFISNETQAQSHLTKAQSTVIKRAKTQNIPISIQEIFVDGSKKTVVILGEAHIKPKKISKMELEVIDSFNLRLFEGYDGNGQSLKLKEKTSMALIGLLYPFVEFIENGEESSIRKSVVKGYLVRPNGDTFYNGCHLGLLAPEGFAYKEKSIKNIITRLPPPDIGRFFKKLKHFTRKSIETRARLETKELAFRDRNYLCQDTGKLLISSNFFNIGIELGDLSIWNKEKICGDLLCYSKNFSKPSSRDLRMADNIYENFRSFPEYNTAIVVVGKNHIPYLEYLLPSWPSIRDQFIYK